MNRNTLEGNEMPIATYAKPSPPLKGVGFIRDDIVDVCDMRMELLETGEDEVFGLCNTFDRVLHNRGSYGAYEMLPKALKIVGGRTGDDYGYFWPRTRKGNAQRLMFLAFMLTWWDDEC